MVTPVEVGTHIEGAVFIGSDPTTGMDLWEWSLTQPTDIRSDPTYSKVCLINS